MRNRVSFALATVMVLMAFLFGCKKKTAENETVAEMQISQSPEEEALKNAQNRVARLEQELGDLETDLSGVSQQQREKYRSTLKVQIQEAKAIVEEIVNTIVEKKSKIPSDIKLANGTNIVVTLHKEVSTATYKTSSAWEGRLAADLIVNDSGNNVVWTAGTPVRGIVTKSASLHTLENGGGELAIILTDIGGTKVNGGEIRITADTSKAQRIGAIAGSVVAGTAGVVITVFTAGLDFGASTVTGISAGAAGGGWAGAKIGELLADNEITIPIGKPITFVAN